MTLASLRQIESVPVFKRDVLAGTLTRTPHGAQFAYDDVFRRTAQKENRYGLSFSMPPSQSIYDVSGTNLHPYFAGLLPEGLRLRALRQVLKTSEDDLFSMLLALGSNCVGDVHLKTDPLKTGGEVLEISSPEETSFLELFQRSITATDVQTREADTGVPGVIPKMSASMLSFPVRIAKKRKQYLLKLPTKDHPQIIENEHFFMRMAKACGLDAAPTAVVKDRNGVPGLLVERFDRGSDNQSKRIFRRHQEDACQFLDRYPQDKYRLSLREIAEGIERICGSPIIEIRKLIEAYMFSYLIGNGDLHAKNISLLEVQEGGRISFSPCYDLLSTLPYGDRTMALRMGAKDDNFTTEDFVTFAKLFDIPEKAIRALTSRLLSRARPWIKKADEIGLPKKKIADFIRTFDRRAQRLADE